MKISGRERRHYRIRRKIQGTEEFLRAVVFRSKKHIYIQFVNDTKNHTIFGVSSLNKEVKELIKTTPRESLQNGITLKLFIASCVGKVAAQKAKERGIKKIRFDRGGYKYHGRVKALAEGLREGGLEF